MRIIILATLLVIATSVKSQTLIMEESDSTLLSEYNDGRLWAYRQIDDIVVGMTNYEEKDDYGKYYQIAIFIKNLGNCSITFNPENVASSLYTKQGDSLDMQVYTYEEYMKKVKNAQAWSMALLGFSAGLNAGMAGYQTTYTTSYMPNVGFDKVIGEDWWQKYTYTQAHTTYNYAAASAANMAATTQMMTLSKMMADDKKTISKGYLKINTIHPDEGIIGYMNIKRKKGSRMTVNIPVEGKVFSFDWDLRKKSN